MADLEEHFDKFNTVLDENKERKLQQLIEYSKECNQLMTLINDILSQLGQLKTEYDSVFSKTNDVHSSCQNVMNQHVSHAQLTTGFPIGYQLIAALDFQKSLISSVEEINMKLSYFKEYKVLERVTSSFFYSRVSHSA